MSDAIAAVDREHMLAHTGALWEDVRGRSVFVTGGTGFVGTWFVEAFAAANRAYALDARIVLLSRDPERFRKRAPHLAADRAIELHAGDATDFVYPGGDFAFVLHAATERSHPADAAHPLSVLDSDFAATRRVLDFARSASTKRLLFTSSGAVYGTQPSGVAQISESYAGAPDTISASTAYGQSKRLSEFACVSYGGQFGFAAVVARLFAFVGAYLPLDEGYAVGNFIGDALGGRRLSIHGDGTPQRSYLYAADLAVWLWTLLFRGRGGRAYNVGSSESLSIEELARSVVRNVAPGTGIDIARGPRPGAEPERYVPATSRARDELGLHARIPLDDALRRYYSSCRLR